MKTSTFPQGARLLERVHGARCPAELHRLRAEAVTVGDLRAFFHAVGLVATHFDEALVEAALSDPDGAVALKHNPALSPDLLLRALSGMAEQFARRAVGEDSSAPRGQESAEGYPPLRRAIELGLVSASSPLREILWQSIEQNARRLRDFQMTPHLHLSLLLAFADLPRGDLLRMAEEVETRYGTSEGDDRIGWAQTQVEGIVRHPQADAEVWERVVERSLSHTRWLDAMLKCPRARRDPGVGEHLLALVRRDVEERRILDVLLRSASGESFRQAWLLERERSPQRAAEVLKRAGQAKLASLHALDLAPLLASGNASVREVAVSSVGRIGLAASARVGERPSSQAADTPRRAR